jgi:type I restriction enzyme S subunit
MRDRLKDVHRDAIVAIAAECRRVEPEDVPLARTRRRQLDNHWKEVPLGILVDIFDGPHATPRKTQAGPVFLGISNLSSGRLDFENTEHLSEADYVRWTRRVAPQPNDIVFSYETRLGEAALIPEGLRVCLGRRMGLLRPKAGAIDARYLLYAFLGEEFQNTLRSRTVHGSTVDRIPLTEMAEFPISVPREISEQCAIARVLGTLDDKIELNQRMNETLEAMARALFKSWFVDFDPVRAKCDGCDPGLAQEFFELFPESFDNEGRPQGWSAKPLDDVAEFLNGLAMQKFPPSEVSGSLPVIKISELRSGITQKTGRASRNIPSEYVVRDGDFLFSWSGSLLAKFWTSGEGALNQHLFKVTPGRYPMWFCSHWVYHHLEEFQAIAASKATTMGHIQRGHLKQAMATCPPDDVLAELGHTMELLVDRVIKNDIESRTLVEVRDLLLVKLISGELRVPSVVNRIGNAT